MRWEWPTRRMQILPPILGPGTSPLGPGPGIPLASSHSSEVIAAAYGVESRGRWTLCGRKEKLRVRAGVADRVQS